MNNKSGSCRSRDGELGVMNNGSGSWWESNSTGGSRPEKS